MTGYGLYPGNGMHDVFHMDDLTNDAQHHALAYWLHVARRDRGLPVAAFTALNLPGVAADSYVLFELFDERIRDAVIRDVAPGVAKALGIHPVGLRLSQVMPPVLCGRCRSGLCPVRGAVPAPVQPGPGDLFGWDDAFGPPAGAALVPTPARRFACGQTSVDDL